MSRPGACRFALKRRQGALPSAACYCVRSRAASAPPHPVAAEPLLSRIDRPEPFERVGEWVIDCEGPEDFLRRLRALDPQATQSSPVHYFGA